MSRERKEYRYKVSGVRKVRGDRVSDRHMEYRYEVTGPKHSDEAEGVRKEYRGAGIGIGGFLRGITNWFRKIGGGTVRSVKKRVGKRRRRRGRRDSPTEGDKDDDDDNYDDNEDEESDVGVDTVGSNDAASMPEARGRPFPSPNVYK